MAQNGDDNNGNRSDRQMAPVSSQFCKQMFFSAGYGVSLSPGTLKREYKDSLGRVEVPHINCAKYWAWYTTHPCPPVPLRRQVFRAAICSTLNVQACDF